MTDMCCYDGTAYPDSEQQILGGLLISDDLYKKYTPKLESSDFSSQDNQTIFKAIYAAWKKGKPVDEGLVSSDISADLRGIVIDCAEAFRSERANFIEHLKLVKAATPRRRIKRELDDISLSGDYDVERLRKTLDSLEISQPFGVTERNNQAFEQFTKELNKPKFGFYTGFSGLDKALGGIRRGTLTVIGARPSTGKTTFAINMVRRQLRDNRKSLFFSLEMTADMILERYCAAVCLIDVWKFGANKLDDKEIGAVKGVIENVKRSGQLIIDQDTNSIENITAEIYSDKPDIVFIDYVQRIRSLKDFRSERERVNYITNELKTVAKRTNCSVVLLSQIARTGKDAPKMSDLKESGALEEDGDYIMLLHRPYVLDKNDERYKPEDTFLILDKNKFGRTAAMKLYFNTEQQRFTERKNE